MLYEAGDGVARDQAQSLAWYRRAALQGEPGAEAEIGGYYEEGDGVPDDWVEAAAWYRRSAEQGWMKGELALGRAYQYGIGVPLDLGAAITWYDRAAAHGHPNAAQLAKYLRDNHGQDGSTRNEQEQTMLGPLVQRNAPLNCAGPIVSGGGNVENAASCGFGAGDLPNAGKKLLVDKLKFNPSIPQTHCQGRRHECVAPSARSCVPMRHCVSRAARPRRHFACHFSCAYEGAPTEMRDADDVAQTRMDGRLQAFESTRAFAARI